MTWPGGRSLWFKYLWRWEKEKEELLPGKATGLSQSLQDYLNWGSEWITVAHAWVAESAAWAVIGSIGAPLISWFWLQHSSGPRWVHSTKVFTLHWRTSQISQWIPAEKQQTQIWRMGSPGRGFKSLFHVTNSLLFKAGRERTPGMDSDSSATFQYCRDGRRETKTDGASVERNLGTKSCWSLWSECRQL